MTITANPKPHLPFLQRNWNQAVGNHWQPVGAKISAQRRTILGDGGENRRSIDVGNGNGIGINHSQNGAPPSKRPRICKDPSPDDPDPSTVLAQIPSIDDFLLPKAPSDTAPPALRIDILKISHRDSERRVKPRASLTSLDEPTHPLIDERTIRARCKITLLDMSPLCRHAPPVVHCSTQGCDIKTFKNPVGSSGMARIYLDEPFLIPEEEIKVVKEDGTFGLADQYRLDVEMYGIDSKHWPPLDIMPRSTIGAGPIPSRWVLLCCVGDLFRKSRPSVDLYVHQYTRECLTPTNFAMEVESRWSSAIGGTAATLCTENMKGGLPSITVGAHVNGEVLTNGYSNGSLSNGHSEDLVNGDSGSFHNDSGRALSEEPDGETTPNRSLRNRSKAVYNLKVLSDKAQGKERKRRKRLAASANASDGCVVYLIPSEEVSLDSFRCIACAAPHQSLQLLQLHLKTSHSEYSYELRSARGLPQFRVAHQHERYSFQPDEFQYTKPSKAFNLDRVANGQAAWLDESPQPLTAPERAMPARAAAPRRPKLPPKKVIVPRTKQPLYDSVSRARLEPGTEFIPPKFENEWWLQKHRDMINDYVDIDMQEREYLLEWDSFCLPKRLSADIFVPQIWLSFVKEKASWIVKKGERQEEFLKHLAYLQARDAVDQRTSDAAVKLVHEARTKMKDETENGSQASDSPKEPGDRKYRSCEVCGVANVGVVCILTCSNLECSRQFHLNCIQDSIKMDPTAEAWLCNDCTSKEDITAPAAP